MSFTVVFEPETELEIIEAFQWYEEQSFGLGGDFLKIGHGVSSNIPTNTKTDFFCSNKNLL